MSKTKSTGGEDPSPPGRLSETRQARIRRREVRRPGQQQVSHRHARAHPGRLELHPPHGQRRQVRKGRGRQDQAAHQSGRQEGRRGNRHGVNPGEHQRGAERARPAAGAWSDAQWLPPHWVRPCAPRAAESPTTGEQPKAEMSASAHLATQAEFLFPNGPRHVMTPDPVARKWGDQGADRAVGGRPRPPPAFVRGRGYEDVRQRRDGMRRLDSPGLASPVRTGGRIVRRPRRSRQTRPSRTWPRPPPTALLPSNRRTTRGSGGRRGFAATAWGTTSRRTAWSSRPCSAWTWTSTSGSGVASGSTPSPTRSSGRSGRRPASPIRARASSTSASANST